MKQRLCAISTDAPSKLPAHTDDKSGVGVHYVDAYLKPMNATLPDGTAVKCKRRGIKITLQVGAAKGEGLLRRIEVGPDPVAMLDRALQEAAKNAGVGLSVEAGELFLTTATTEPPGSS